MRCCVCNNDLQPAHIFFVEALECPGCHGVWLDRLKVAEMVRSVTIRVAERFTGQRRLEEQHK